LQAFDKVPHKRLVEKLKAYGIQGDINRWIENWLKERKQRVVVNGVCSKWADVCSGVPQGSVLGPLLFTIFIDDIDEDLKSKIAKFADDTNIGKAVKAVRDSEELQEDLDKLYIWSQTWLMEFNKVSVYVCM